MHLSGTSFHLLVLLLWMLIDFILCSSGVSIDQRPCVRDGLQVNRYCNPVWTSRCAGIVNTETATDRCNNHEDCPCEKYCCFTSSCGKFCSSSIEFRDTLSTYEKNDDNKYKPITGVRENQLRRELGRSWSIRAENDSLTLFRRNQDYFSNHKQKEDPKNKVGLESRNVKDYGVSENITESILNQRQTTTIGTIEMLEGKNNETKKLTPNRIDYYPIALEDGIEVGLNDKSNIRARRAIYDESYDEAFWKTNEEFDDSKYKPNTGNRGKQLGRDLKRSWSIRAKTGPPTLIDRNQDYFSTHKQKEDLKNKLGLESKDVTENGASEIFTEPISYQRQTSTTGTIERLGNENNENADITTRYSHNGRNYDPTSLEDEKQIRLTDKRSTRVRRATHVETYDEMFWKAVVEVIFMMYQNAPDGDMRDALSNIKNMNMFFMSPHTERMRNIVSHALSKSYKPKEISKGYRPEDNLYVDAFGGGILKPEDVAWWRDVEVLLDSMADGNWTTFRRAHRSLKESTGLSNWESLFKTPFLFLIEKIGKKAYDHSFMYIQYKDSSDNADLKVMFEAFNIISALAFSDNSGDVVNNHLDILASLEGHQNFDDVTRYRYSIQKIICPAIVKVVRGEGKPALPRKGDLKNINTESGVGAMNVKFWENLTTFLMKGNLTHAAADLTFNKDVQYMFRHEQLMAFLMMSLVDHQ